MINSLFKYTSILSLLIIFFFSMGCGVNDEGNDQDQTRYFLVGESAEHKYGDSYILPLSSKEDIAKALDILKQDISVRKTIIIAKIEKGGAAGKYVNKDLLNNEHSGWSWRITEFIGFSDNSIEIYDGWPTYVEENLDDWMHNTEGKIGFWNYTLLREVRSDELQ